MPQGNTHIPKYCRHKARDLAFVRLEGRTIYLGRYDAPESRAEYDRVVGLWTLNGRRLPQEFQRQEIPASAYMTQAVRDVSRTALTGPAPGTYTMAHLCGDYLTEMENRYQSKQGSRRTELGRIKTTLRPVVRFFGREPAEEFSPKKLKLVRQFFINLGHVRTEINKRMRAIRKMMRWGVAEEHIPAETYMKFVEIEPLKPNDYGVKEPTPVKPVKSEMIEKTLPFLNRFVAAMVKVQLCTGARPEEICLMRGCDIERTEKAWIYTPLTHKLAWRGQVRQIVIGPNAQAILKDFLNGDPNAFLFSPRIAQEEHLAAAAAERKTPLSCGNVRGSKRKNHPLKEPGEHYTPDSYWRAVASACRKAFPLPDHLQRKLITPTGRKRKARPETVAEWRARLTEEGLYSQVSEWEQEHRWFPYQIRHSAATRIRKEAGIEAAQVVLGQVSGKCALEKLLVHCEATGNLVLPSELVACDLTGKQVLPSELAICSVSHKRVTKVQLVQSHISGAWALPEYIIRSPQTRRGCLLSEAIRCTWVGDLYPRDEISACRLSGLNVAREFLNDSHELHVLRELLDGREPGRDGADLGRLMTEATNGQNFKSIRCVFSSDGKVRAVCAESRSLLGFRVRLVGAVTSEREGLRHVVGRVVWGRRHGNSWLMEA